MLSSCAWHADSPESYGISIRENDAAWSKFPSSMNHGTDLSTSVQEMDPASLSNPQCPQLLSELMNVPLCEEELKHLIVYRPLLDGDGFYFRGTGSSEDEADVHLEASRQFRVSLKRNEEHFKAWGAQESLLTNLSLEKPISDGASNPDDQPFLLGNLDASRQFRINLRRNKEHFKAWQTQEFMHTTIKLDGDGASMPCVQMDKRRGCSRHANLSSQEQAKRDKGFVPYATCLKEILMSDGSNWNFLLDDVMQVLRDVTNELADLHAACIVYGDMRVENIFLNDLMQAFLIQSEKSKKENNKDRLIDECAVDTKELCKIMGGMMMFYVRNKPPESRKNNQEDETALYNLLKKGSRGILTARDIIEELGRIVVIDDARIDEPVGATALKEKSGLGLGDYTPEPKSGTADDGPEPEVGPVNSQVSHPKSGAFDEGPGLEAVATNAEGPIMVSASVDGQSPKPRSASIDYEGPKPSSGPMDIEGAEPVPERGAVDTNASKPSCEVISTPVPMPEAGAMNYNTSEPRSEVTSTPDSVTEALAVSMVLSGLGLGAEGSGAVSNQAPENGSGALAEQGQESRDNVSRSLELRSAEVEGLRVDRELSDQGSTHEQLMSDFEMEMYFSASENSFYYDASN